jgi:methionyl-tRNA formyltransferase
MALNIIFMGTPGFAVPILKSINESNHNILEVYTQPPKKKNRGQKISSSPIHEYSNQIKLKVRYPNTLDSDKELKHLSDLDPDIVVVVAYGKILPPKLLNLKNILFINIHASLLPKWRGAAPIHRSIMNLDKETGISIMKIISKLDAGPVMLTEKIKIEKETDYEDLSQKLSKLGSEMILKSLDLLKNDKAKFIPQNEKYATYAKKIDKEEAKINWNEDAKYIVAKVNALNPNPGTWFELGESRVKIIKATEVKEMGEPGVIINKNLTIACSENAVQILELQKEGKKKMTAREFLAGNKLEVGTSINSDV